MGGGGVSMLHTIDNYIDNYLVKKLQPYVDRLNERKTVSTPAKISQKAEPSKYQGEINGRVYRMVTCRSSFFINEVSIITKFRDASGNVYVWFNAGTPKTVVGQKYYFSGIVRNHRMYRDVEETQVHKVQITPG